VTGVAHNIIRRYEPIVDVRTVQSIMCMTNSRASDRAGGSASLTGPASGPCGTARLAAKWQVGLVDMVLVGFVIGGVFGFFVDGVCSPGQGLSLVRVPLVRGVR
jgi:hypothetical protein